MLHMYILCTHILQVYLCIAIVCEPKKKMAAYNFLAPQYIPFRPIDNLFAIV